MIQRFRFVIASLLVLVGTGSFLAIQRPATLIPASFGAILFVLTLLARKEQFEKPVFQASAAVMVFGTLATLLSLGRAIRVVMGWETEIKPEVWSLAAMSILCGVYVSYVIRSMFRARAAAVILVFVLLGAVSMHAQKTFTKAPSATKKYALTASAQFYVDPKVWVKNKQQSIEGADVEFTHTDGTAFVAVISQKQFLAIDTFIDAFVEGMRESAKEVTVKERANLIVNGTPITACMIEMKDEGVDVTYLAYFYSGTKGMVQALSYCGTEIFAEMSPVLQAALNGLVVKK